MTGRHHERGSVADEAMRLVSALAALSPQRGESYAAEGAQPHDDESEGERHTCPCTRPAVAAVCDHCPICGFAAFVAEVRPETIDQISGLLTMAAGSLNEFAEQRRAETGEQPAEPNTADFTEQSAESNTATFTEQKDDPQ